MDLNEFLTIDKSTTLDDLDIMINELDILILLCQKTYWLKKHSVNNTQYKMSLLDFIKVDDRLINIDEFIMDNNRISLVAYEANKAYFEKNVLKLKLFDVLFSSNDNYWNDSKRNLAKEKIEIINNKIFSLTRLRMGLFWT